MDPFCQEPHRCRLEWGIRGARRAAERGDILVVVDVFSFSTVVVTALHHGAVVYPCAEGEDADAWTARVGGERIVKRREVPSRGRFSLSPATYAGVAPGTRIVVPSRNGGSAVWAGREAPCVLVGALVNARAVSAAVERLLARDGRAVTVLACGERWETPSEEGTLRPALEDYLAAGAILSGIGADKSPEARACEAAYTGVRADLSALLHDCGSGRELRAIGFAGDVDHSVAVDAYGVVPVLRGEKLEPLAD